MKSCVEILRALREDANVSQTEIANLIGTTQQQYSNYETGESELPLRALERLADYYHVSTDYLLGRTEYRVNTATLDQKVCDSYTAGTLISDVMMLGAVGRAAVADYISLQMLRLKCEKKKEKDGSRG